MLKRSLVVVLLLGALGYGLAHLFLLRFRAGDVFSPYSSLRADPLGVKGFCEALDELPRLKVRRNYRPIEKLNPADSTTLIYAGTPYEAFWRERELRSVEQLALNGVRVVITFLPLDRGPTEREKKRKAEEQKRLKEERERAQSRADKEKAKDGKGDGETKKESASKDGEEETEPEILPFSQVAKRWGFEFRFLGKKGEQGTFRRRAQLGSRELPLEPEISWHSALYFEALKPEWRTIYTCEERPVVIERKYGDGSIVLAADSYFLSNEAMRKERLPQFLAWVVGPVSTVVFDEESHGVRDDPGIASLARKYRLHGVAAGLLLLALLFVWKNAAPFLPPLEETNVDAEVVLGKEAGEGFNNLLRRSIPKAEMLAVCAAEWKKAFDHDGRHPHAGQVAEALASEQARPPRERNPVAAYRRISQFLAQKS
ncbi:MAG: hypothetical protein M3463_15415 [Verrucomicrobiota bacterium]|nr:hypothetical protein [Verrucomicrobiota bacterium]